MMTGIKGITSHGESSNVRVSNRFYFNENVGANWTTIAKLDVSRYGKMAFSFGNSDDTKTAKILLYGTFLPDPDDSNLTIENGWFNLQGINLEGVYTSYGHTTAINVGAEKVAFWWGLIPVQNIVIRAQGSAADTPLTITGYCTG